MGWAVRIGSRVTHVFALLMWLKLHVSAESRWISYGGENLIDDVESIDGVYVKTPFNIISPILAKHMRDVG